MLIKVSAFNDVMNSKFYADCEDPYIRVNFQTAHKKVGDCREAPLYMGNHPLDVQYFVELGRMYYRLGWTPRMASTMFEKPPSNVKKIFIVLSYFVACLTKPKKMDTFNFVRTYQTRSLARHITDALWRL